MAENGGGGTVQDMTRNQAAAVLVALGIMAGITSCSGADNGGVSPIELEGSGTSEVTETTAAGAAEDYSQEYITVLVDGWSMAGISKTSITWSATNDGLGTQVSFAEAGKRDLEAAAEKDPEAVRSLVARMVTADPSLTCDKGGCRTDSREIPYEDLIQPASGKVLGASYSDYGIAAGVYAARIPGRTATLRYGSSTYNITQIGEGEAAGLGAEAGTGVEAVAVAFGVIFPITPEWLGGEHGYKDRLFYDLGEATVPAVTPEKFFGGLAAVVEGAATLSAGQLTWRSSPTTGCGVGVLCVPGITKAEVKSLGSTSFKVCNGENTGKLEVGAVDVSYTYGARTNQFGVWGDVSPDGKLGGRGLVWTTEPVYTSGASSQHHVYAHLYDGLGLFDKTGRVSTIGLDPETDTKYIPGPEYLQKAFGGTWKVC